jgi:TetR/AcrR family transcriptional regulator
VATHSTHKKASSGPRVPRKRAVAPRRPGRPSGGASGTERRNRLLDTALTLFARQGIANTTLAAIAGEAGVTPAMVHYYFKTRDQLLDVLIEERFLPVRTAVEGVLEANANDPVTAIVQLVRRLMDIAASHPWFAPLWIREIVNEDGVLKQRIRRRFGDEHQQSMIRCIARWQAEGRLNPDIEPALIFMSLFGMTILPLLAARNWRDDPLRSRLGAEDIARHAMALLTHGVGPRG